MKQHPNDEDDSPPGGRALDRLRQFEIERGYEDSGPGPSTQQEGEGQGEATGESQQGETDGGASEADAALADC
jgi:hypothetical protein